ncbi:MAG: histone deacetylase [Planctomycetota bacterium]
MNLFYSDTFELPLPDGHRFPMAKYRRLRERLQNAPFRESLQFHLPPSTTDEQLLLVHTPEYLKSIRSGQLSALQQRRIGFPWSEKMVERSRRSTGASIAAGRAAMVGGLAANLAGGTHHSFAECGQGYCVFNDTCVAARVLQQESQVENVLIVDLDVHQGNGTAAIVRDDPSIFAFSVHCNKNYPFQKTSGDFDLALEEGTGDEEYVAAVSDALEQIDRYFEADLVFYLAGADPFAGDRLGLLNLTKPGLARRDRLVINYFRDRNVPLALAMAGGYAPDLDDIVDIHFQTIEIAVERLILERKKLDVSTTGHGEEDVGKS